MALNAALSTKGASSNPLNTFNPVTLGGSSSLNILGAKSTPQANALSKATQAPSITHPTSNAPVKKQTVNNIDGSSTTTEYQTPKYGDTVTDSMGRTGVAKFDPKTGKPLSNPAQSQSTQTPVVKQEPASFKGLINNLSNQQSSPYNQLATKNIGLLSDVTGQNQQYADRAREIADAAGQRISDIGGMGARGQAGYLTTGTSPVGEGNAAILAQTTAAQQRAVSEGANMQLAGNQQGLTAQGQLQSGYGTAAGQALTGQGQAQSALGTAAGLASPQLGAIGQVPFDPLTQGQGNVLGTNGGGINQAGALLGQFDAAKATASSQGQQIQSYTSALQQGQNLQTQLGDLITTFGLNPNDVNVVNQGLQKIARNVSSPQYKMLENYVNDIANTYAQILTPSGGSQTDTTRSIAASMLDATASGESILAVMHSLDEAAKAKIAGVSTQGNNTSTTGGGTSWDDL